MVAKKVYMNCPNCDAPYETTGDEDGFAACFSCNHEFEFNMIPTLFSLTPNDKIRLVAELDGMYYGTSDTDSEECWRYRATQEFVRGLMPDYSTSYDAIIPLIQKQTPQVKWHIWDTLSNLIGGGIWESLIEATPSQLLDALLVATGKATI